MLGQMSYTWNLVTMMTGSALVINRKHRVLKILFFLNVDVELFVPYTSIVSSQTELTCQSCKTSVL